MRRASTAEFGLSLWRKGTWCHEASVCVGALSLDIRRLSMDSSHLSTDIRRLSVDIRRLSVAISPLSTDIRPLYSVHLPPAGARAGWANSPRRFGTLHSSLGGWQRIPGSRPAASSHHSPVTRRFQMSKRFPRTQSEITALTWLPFYLRGEVGTAGGVSGGPDRTKVQSDVPPGTGSATTNVSPS